MVAKSVFRKFIQLHRVKKGETERKGKRVVVSERKKSDKVLHAYEATAQAEYIGRHNHFAATKKLSRLTNYINVSAVCV